MLKRFLIIIAIFFVLLLALLIALPIVYQDNIKEMIQTELSASLEADVAFEDVGLSFFRSFPNGSIGIKKLSIINRERPFRGDTLVYADALLLEVDIWSLWETEMKVIKAVLDRPLINIQVEKDGKANYNIYLAEEEVAVADTTPAMGFDINIQGYEIKKGRLRYIDKAMPLEVDVQGLDHTGKGDISAKFFSFDTNTSIESLTTVFDGIKYLNKAKVSLDAELDVEEEPGGYFITLKDNSLLLNELGLRADGTIDYREEGMMFDLTWNAPEADFRKLISLVPAVYASDIKGVDLRGGAALSGYVQGRYDEKHLPGFGVQAKVENGYLHYPDLPNSLTNIHFDLDLKEPDGTFQRTRLHIPSFHADLGDTPINGALTTSGTGPIDIEGRLKTNLDLGSLSQTFPIEKTTLKGILDIDATSKGTYDEEKGTFPATTGILSFKDGYVRYEDYPTELSDIQVEGKIDGNENLAQAMMEVSTFHFLLDGEPMDGSLRVQDFNDPRYEIAANGSLDLDKLTEVFPLEDMELGGKIIVNDFATKGRYSDIEAERYINLPTSGSGRVQNITYDSPDMAEALVIEQGEFRFDPGKLTISNAQGKLGESDFSMSGSLDNYLAYALLDNQLLTGNFTVNSNVFNVNPWIEEEEGAPATGAGEEVYVSYPVPPGTDITFDASIQQLKYQDFNLKEIQGQVKVIDEAVRLSNTTFNLLGAKASLNGSYATPGGTDEPQFTFMADLSGLAPDEAFEAFSMVKTYAPIAKLIDGIANFEFAINGKLGRDLYPLMESITSKGFFEVTEGQSKTPKIIQKAAQFSGIGALDHLDLSGAKGWFTIENGKVILEPMDFSAGPVKLNIGGVQSITGALDMKLLMDMPAGSIGTAFRSKLSQYTGGAIETSDRVKMRFTVGGTILNPTVTPETQGAVETVKDALANTVKDKAQDLIKDKTGLGVDLEKDAIKQKAKEAEQKARDSIAAVAKAAEQRVRDSIKAAEQRVRDSLDAALAREKAKAEEELKKKLEKELGGEAKDKLDELKNKLKSPFGQKKKKQ